MDREMLLINEALVSQFKFWRDGEVRRGMWFRHQLFGYVRSFDRGDRQQAFDFSARLSDAGVDAMLTVSASQYTLWVSLAQMDLGLSEEWSASAHSMIASN
jgi:hypothetical protein